MVLWWETNLGAGAVGAVLGAVLGSGLSFVSVAMWDSYKAHQQDAVAIQSMLKGMDQCLRAAVINKFLLEACVSQPTGSVDYRWTPITPLPTAFEDVWMRNSPEIHVAEGPMIFHEGLQMLAHNIRSFNELARRRDDLGIQITTMEHRNRSAAVSALTQIDARLLSLLSDTTKGLSQTRNSLLAWSSKLNRIVKLRG